MTRSHAMDISNHSLISSEHSIRVLDAETAVDIIFEHIAYSLLPSYSIVALSCFLVSDQTTARRGGWLRSHPSSALRLSLTRRARLP